MLRASDSRPATRARSVAGAGAVLGGAVSGASPLSAAPSPSSSRSHANACRGSGLGVLALLLALRIANALTLRTFFQPDEFFQSLEPAWQLAFGETSNAWITWEWRTQLRSSLHPQLFARVYLVAANLALRGGCTLPSQAELLVAAPKVTQAVFAALLDYYTWKLAERAYGRASRTAWTTLALSICSPWQWFCSTRTLSNCLETTLTSIAVYYWPWHWQGPAERDRQRRIHDHKQIADQDILGSLAHLRLSLLLAASACILRPTNALIWLAVSIPTLWQSSTRERYVLVREILFCGPAVLICSALSDRLYYQAWTLPPLRFLYFNIVQSLAVFYGRNRPDYYLTEGLPLLLTTALPFALVGIWQALQQPPTQTQAAASEPKSTDKTSSDQISSSRPAPQGSVSQVSSSLTEVDVSRRILSRLAWASIITTLALTLISHKEVRFLYPILPFLHVLAARPLSSFFSHPHQPVPSPPNQRNASYPLLHPSLSRRAILFSLLALNVFIAGYVSQVHQRGVIDVLSYIRHKHEARMTSNNNNATKTTVAFLMPCHSTPWRSHLVYPGIDAWALTCEPPLDIPVSERDGYLDEADQFYLDPGPAEWLRGNMEHLQTIQSSGSRSAQHWMGADPFTKKKNKRPWPMNLVFFEQLEPQLKEYLDSTRYTECWRGFNSHFHDDWRRQGDVVVWCLN